MSSIEGGGRRHICPDDRLLPRRSMGQPGMKNYDVVYPACGPIRLESSLESRGGREPSLGRVGYMERSLYPLPVTLLRQASDNVEDVEVLKRRTQSPHGVFNSPVDEEGFTENVRRVKL